MDILTLKEVIRDVPKRWKHQYPQGKDGVYEKLIAAKPLSKKKVDTIIGNFSWARLECDECETEVKLVLCFKKFNVCEACLNRALDVINEEK